jgi:hypothetical protein
LLVGRLDSAYAEAEVSRVAALMLLVEQQKPRDALGARSLLVPSRRVRDTYALLQPRDAVANRGRSRHPQRARGM